MCETSGSTEPTDLAPYGEGEDDESVRLKKYVGWWEARHNENDVQRFPDLVREKNA